MSSLSAKELEAARKAISKSAGRRQVAAACVYGSKAAGYARPDSDIDLLVVLEGYPLVIRYAYIRQDGIDISLLMVSRRAFEADASNAALGEFVAGRLLHIYEPLVNPQLFKSAELLYRKRVILEELQGLLDSTSLLGTEIRFPLEYVLFSKLKQRISRYPNATYSFFRTYEQSPASGKNLQYALSGYSDALAEIIREGNELIALPDGLFQIPDRSIFVEGGKVRLRLAKRVQQVGSYFVHTYAGRQVLHLMIKEADSKIRRRQSRQAPLPERMVRPKKVYWSLPEGELVVESKDWLAELAGRRGYSEWDLAHKKRVGNINSRTFLHVLSHSRGEYKLAVKEHARTKSVKWAALSLWTSPVKRFKVGPLFRLGTQYKGLRFIRGLGLDVPEIEAVVLDYRLFVTKFVEGHSLSSVIKEAPKHGSELHLLRRAGSKLAVVHNAGASFGNIKPKDIIVSGDRLFFTDAEQFLFNPGDQPWDLAQFICWGLKGTRNTAVAKSVVREFLEGYLQSADSGINVKRLASSRRHLESFLPVLNLSVARSIREEVAEIAR